MISFVSTSDNGNLIPEAAVDLPELLWVRHCDRLEAIGVTGAVRCYQYTLESDRILDAPETPRPKTKEEIWDLVTPKRFKSYMKTKASKSMMCHYYDKLLHIAATYKKDPKSVANDWIVKEAISRVEPMENICLLYGKKGKVPEDLIKSYMKEEDLIAAQKPKELSVKDEESDSEMSE